MNRNLIYITGILLIAGGMFFVLSHPNQTISDSQFLRSQMRPCGEKQLSDNCYMQVAGTLMAKWDYVKILQLLKDNEQYPEIFSRCHELTHYIGRKAYEQEGSVSKVYSRANPVCWGGFYHGVMESYFWDKHLSLTDPDSPKITEALQTACGKISDYTSPRFYSECVHGIGHAMMFITDTDLNKSLALCDKLEGNQPTICYGGVFMENSSSSTNTAHPTEFLKASDPMYPCDALATRYLNICYQYQSSYFAELSKYDWKKNADLCMKVPEIYREGCFHIIGTNQVGSTQDYAKMENSCSLMPSANYVQICQLGVVDGLSGRYVGQTNKIGDFCAQLNSNFQEACFKNLGSNIKSWTTDPAKLSADCAELKNSEYIRWCMSSGGGFNTDSQSFN
ncbi:MAG: hypothetical protein ABI643_00095 [Candidatus Doudnabacteria bacterium]